MTAADNVDATTVQVSELLRRPHLELLAAADKLGLEVPPHLAHDELVAALVTHQLAGGAHVVTDGVLDILPEGFGFVRMLARDLAASAVDAYVSPGQVRSLNLKVGHRLRGPVRAPQGTERFFALVRIEQLQGEAADNLSATVPFADRTPLVPTRPLPLLDDPADADEQLHTLAALAPWCHGHRVLVTAPATWPRASLLARLTTGLLRAAPAPQVVVCLLEQRPEDIAAVRGRLGGSTAQLVATTFATPPERHVTLATMALATARRMVEHGRDVVLLLDSLTAAVRAAGRTGAPSGAWAHPGIDVLALQFAKQLFASARQFAEGGSLTVIATTSIDPDSAVDALIHREFAAASNSDVSVDPTLAAQQTDLPFDLLRTRTRPEDDPRSADERHAWRTARNRLLTMTPTAAAAQLRAWLQPGARPGA